MTADDFRKLALALPEASEGEHMEHPDFRVGGKIFATIGPDGTCAMVKLSMEDQSELARTEPASFEAFPGAWGRHGSTRVRLKEARPHVVREALASAWRNTAPKRLVKRCVDLGEID